jgi:hypothetical protein
MRPTCMSPPLVTLTSRSDIMLSPSRGQGPEIALRRPIGIMVLSCLT